MGMDENPFGDAGNGLEGFLESLMDRQVRRAVVEMNEAVYNAVYGEIQAIEPELRTPGQTMFADMFEFVSHKCNVALFGCEDEDSTADPLHVFEFQAELRVKAAEVRRLYKEEFAQCSADWPTESRDQAVFMDNVVSTALENLK